MEKNETTRSPLHWKRKTALAIGKPELANASDEELEAACDEHSMEVARLLAEGDDDGKTVAGLPRDVASAMRVTDAPKTTMPNTAQSVGEQIQALVNSERAADSTLSFEAAYDKVRFRRPDLFNTKAPKGPNFAERRKEEARRNEVTFLVSEKMQAGAGGTGPDAYTNCFSAVQAERPDLFVQQPAPRK